MSLCLRSFPNKFTSFVNTRKQVTKIDRQLPKHAKSSVFLQEFLGAQAAANTVCFEKPINHVTQNVPITFLDTNTEWSENKKNNCNKRQSTWFQQEGQNCIGTLNTIDFIVTSEPVSNKKLEWLYSHVHFNNIYKNKKSCLSHTEMLSINRILANTLVNFETERILYTEVSPNVQNVQNQQPADDRKPTEAQLQTVFDCLRKDLPMLFVRTMNYGIYTEDVAFVNNIRGTATTGLNQYVKQIAFLKIIGHIKFAYVKLDILKMTIHPEDNSIKVRWRIVGISGTKVFLTFWKLKLWNIKEYIDSQQSWYDGFSTFYINNEGKIFKHVVDKLMPDQESYEKVKTPPVAKLALITGLLGLDSYSFLNLCSK